MKNNCNPPENDEGQGNRKKRFLGENKKRLDSCRDDFCCTSDYSNNAPGNKYYLDVPYMEPSYYE